MPNLTLPTHAENLFKVYHGLLISIAAYNTTSKLLFFSLGNIQVRGITASKSLIIEIIMCQLLLSQESKQDVSHLLQIIFYTNGS